MKTFIVDNHKFYSGSISVSNVEDAVILDGILRDCNRLENMLFVYDGRFAIPYRFGVVVVEHNLGALSKFLQWLNNIGVEYSTDFDI